MFYINIKITENLCLSGRGVKDIGVKNWTLLASTAVIEMRHWHDQDMFIIALCGNYLTSFTLLMFLMFNRQTGK